MGHVLLILVVVMEHVDNTYGSLKHYFGVLEQTGLYPKDETYGLLLYTFIVDQVFNGPLSPYLDDAGLAAFNKALNCLYHQGCLISRPDALRLSEPRNRSNTALLRSTEDSSLRITQSSDSENYAYSDGITVEPTSNQQYNDSFNAGDPRRTE